MIAREASETMWLFEGINPRGEEAAEILNQLQMDEKAFANKSAKYRRGGFSRVEFTSDEPKILEDLHETVGSLTGPKGAPLVFIRRRYVKAKVRIERNLVAENNSQYGNDAGHIMQPRAGHGHGHGH
jgi:hypothetical protein